MKKIIVIALTGLFLSSCATQRFTVDGSVRREVPKSNPHYSKWSHFFVYGIGQTDFNNAAKMCAKDGGVDYVETKLTFAQGVVRLFTFGIYTPRTVNVYCKSN